jgi:hypothetical protein
MLSTIQSQWGKLPQYGQALIGGLAGGAVGGAGLGLGTSRRDGESEEEFSARRRQNMISGALTGGAAGAAVPYAASLFGEDKPQSLTSKAVDYWNPMHNTVSGAAAGGAVGAGAGAGVAGAGMGVANKLVPGVINNPLAEQLALEKETMGTLAPGKGQLPAPEFLDSKDKVLRLTNLLKAKGGNSALRKSTYGSLENYNQEFKDLHLERMGRLGKVLRGAGWTGGLAGAGLGAYNAMSE